MEKKTAKRWLSRNSRRIATEAYSIGSRFHKQLLLCRKTVILFENFTNKFS